MIRNSNLKEIYKALIITFFIMFIIISGVIFSLSILKEEAVETNLKIADFHANSVSEQVMQTFVNLNLIIKDLDNSLDTTKDMQLLNTKFTNILLNNPYIRSINLLDSSKRIVQSSNKQNIGVQISTNNFYPKPMFNQAILRFGTPWIGRDFEDAKDVTFLKPIDENSLNFLPIIKQIRLNQENFYIAININIDYFANKYLVNLESNFANLEFIRIDGVLLFSTDKYRKIGTKVKKSALIDEALKNNKSLGIESIDGKKYLTSYKLTDIFPLNIAVGLDFEKTMTKWEEKRELIIIITLLLLFAIALVFTLLYRYAKEQKHEILIQKSTHKALRKAKEVAESANKAKSDFLANMSHEIRTPLNGIIGLTDLVLQSDLDTQQKDYLQKAQKSSNALLYLINDILDYSKIEAGKLNLEYTLFELDDVVESIKDLFEYQANNRGISFQIETPNKLTLIGDSLRVRQILTNIVGNAIKFTQEGFIKLNISIKTEDENHIRLYFSVKDSGIGMSQKAQKNLFEEFTQADTSITREYGGTGLGLSISKQLVNLMDGKIWLKSSLGLGSEFIFELEFAKADVLNKNDIIEEKAQLEDITTIENVSILLTEDDAINQIVAVGILNNLGFSVDIANNGKEAVEKVKTKHYDLILMDIQMPIMDGFEATKIIREFDKTVPIIALSAAVMQKDKLKTKQAGMDGHLEKPIDQKKLYETISAYTQEQNIKPNDFSLEDKTQVSLIDFYGVDMEELKHRIGDKPEIIQQLLLNFCNKYADPENIFKLDEIQSVSFARAIHSLKGISGNVSLKTIFKLSKKIHDSEDIIRKKELTPQLIILLKETTQKLITQLENTKDNFEMEIEYTKAQTDLFFKDFINDLEHFIVIVPNRVKILLQILKHHTDESNIISIKNDLNDYRYTQASEKIKKIYEAIQW